MVFETGNYCLDVDVARTKAYYAPLDGIVCECAGCRNYKKAIHRMAEPVRHFLDQFGIDPGTPIEMSVLHSPDGEKTIYDGFFHICGTILKGTEPWIQTGPKSRMLSPDYLLEAGPDCRAYFVNDCALVAQSFPRPVIQLHISFPLPWLLNEANPYR